MAQMHEASDTQQLSKHSQPYHVKNTGRSASIVVPRSVQTCMQAAHLRAGARVQRVHARRVRYSATVTTEVAIERLRLRHSDSTCRFCGCCPAAVPLCRCAAIRLCRSERVLPRRVQCHLAHPQARHQPPQQSSRRVREIRQKYAER